MGVFRELFGSIGEAVAEHVFGAPRVMSVTMDESVPDQKVVLVTRPAHAPVVPTQQAYPTALGSNRPQSVEIFEGLTIKPTDRLLFLGASGSGKTQMIFHTIRKLRTNYVVLDSVGNLQWMRDSLPNVEYHDIDPADYNQIQTICQQLIHRAKSSKTSFTLIIDEVSEFGVGFNKQGNGLRTIVRKGRNWGIGWIVTSQRTSRLDPLWLTQAKHVFISRFLGENDTKPLSGWSGQPDQFWQQIPIHEFAYFLNGKHEGRFYKLDESEVDLNPTGED